MPRNCDQIAFDVEGEVAMARDLAIRFWRNDRLDGPHFEGLDKGVDVVALVGEESFGPHPARSSLHLTRAGLFSVGRLCRYFWFLGVGPAESRCLACFLWGAPNAGLPDRISSRAQIAPAAQMGRVHRLGRLRHFI